MPSFALRDLSMFSHPVCELSRTLTIAASQASYFPLTPQSNSLGLQEVHQIFIDSLCLHVR